MDGLILMGIIVMLELTYILAVTSYRGRLFDDQPPYSDWFGAIAGIIFFAGLAIVCVVLNIRDRISKRNMKQVDNTKPNRIIGVGNNANEPPAKLLLRKNPLEDVSIRLTHKDYDKDGYFLEVIRISPGKWSWLVRIQKDGHSSLMNTPQYISSPYAATYHPTRGSAEKEAHEYIQSKGISLDDKIPF
jgi:hypothetical protein